MGNAHLFLDTNVIIGFCHPPGLNVDANHCKDVIECDNPKYTCEIVEAELERFMRRTRDLYIGLQSHLRQGNPITSFPLFDVPDKLKDHLDNVIKFIRDQPRKALTALRNLNFYISAQLYRVEQSIVKPFITNHHDKTHAIELEVRCDDRFHPPDSDIINNFIHWAPTLDSVKYITNDGGIIQNIPTIEAYIEETLPRQCAVELVPLRLFSN